MDISKQIELYVNEYKDFMKISHFPNFSLETHTVSILTADSQGFDVAASTSYQPLTGEHTLSVSTNLLLSKYLLFHEFTHMYDSEMFVHGDKIRYGGLSGYTEYHASQIELLLLLKAKAVDSPIPFSMSTIISTFSREKSVKQYVNDKYQHAIGLFGRKDFPANLNTLKSALGVLYNYWGLRSICEMYATDFEEVVNNEVFLNTIPSQLFSVNNNLMHGWLNKEKIELSINLYWYIIFPIIKDNNLA